MLALLCSGSAWRRVREFSFTNAMDNVGIVVLRFSVEKG